MKKSLTKTLLLLSFLSLSLFSNAQKGVDIYLTRTTIPHSIKAVETTHDSACIRTTKKYKSLTFDYGCFVVGSENLVINDVPQDTCPYSWDGIIPCYTEMTLKDLCGNVLIEDCKNRFALESGTQGPWRLYHDYVWDPQT